MYGYKVCEDDLIVKLEILGENNEERPGIIDLQYASYRCNKARVVGILNTYKEMTLAKRAVSKYDSRFIYRVGDNVIPNEWDRDLDLVFTTGIHYFLTFGAAISYIGKPKGYSGVWREWHTNGQVKYEGTYKGGKLEGVYREWYTAGTPSLEISYKDGVKEGPYKNWYNNGQVQYVGHYRGGKLDGLWRKWHYRGHIEIEVEYKDGVQV